MCTLGLLLLPHDTFTTCLFAPQNLKTTMFKIPNINATILITKRNCSPTHFHSLTNHQTALTLTSKLSSLLRTNIVLSLCFSAR